MQRTKPPFRADEVGSLLRSDRVKDARAKLEKGAITADELSKIEDSEIEKIVHKQASVGLKLATDGEFRRSWWHFDFLRHLDGCEMYATEGIQFAGVTTRGEGIRVKGKLDFPANHPMLEHFKFLKKCCEQAGVTPKMTIPSPAVLHFRGGRKAISTDAYPQMDEYFMDLAKVWRKAVKAFYDAGCRYLQLDDTVWSYLCSKDELEKMRARGDDPTGLAQTYARVINYAIAERPADMTITTHVCRGNFRSTWIASGGYEPVAEVLLRRRELRRLLPRIRHRARRRLRAAALPAEGQQDRRRRACHVEERRAGKEGRHQAPARGGVEVRRLRPDGAVAAMRLCLHRGGQHPHRGRAVGEAAPRVEVANEVWGK